MRSSASGCPSGNGTDASDDAPDRARISRRSGPRGLHHLQRRLGDGKPSDMRTGGRAPTLEAAKADFEASWRQWLAWAKLSEVAGPRTRSKTCVARPVR